MAMKIVEDECLSCGDCETVCPSDAISDGVMGYKIDAAACTECDDEPELFRCVDQCSVTGCIVPA